MNLSNHLKKQIHNLILKETDGEPLDGDGIEEINQYLKEVNGDIGGVSQ